MYLTNGGTAISPILGTQGRFVFSGLLGSLVSLDAARHCLFRESEPWVPEDLTTSDTWLISTLAHTHDSFRETLEEYLDSYRSPYYTTQRRSDTSTFESAFGIQKTVSQVRNASPYSRSAFLDLLSSWGDPSMFKPFVEGGIDVNEWGTWWIYLGHAACKQNLKRPCSTTERSDRCVRALPWFLRPEIHIPGTDKLLASFLDGSVSRASHVSSVALTNPKNALRVYPLAIKVLLSNGYCKPWSLHGGADVPINESYMYLAIKHGHTESVQAFLDHGAKVHLQIGDMFVMYEHLNVLQLYTWLTLAVERGDASCTEVLVKHGASINSPDGLGRSALE